MAIKTKKRVTMKDFSTPSESLAEFDPEETIDLPAPYDKIEELPGYKQMKEGTRDRLEASLDDTIAVGIPKPESKEEEEKLVEAFLRGLHNLFSKENNWTFLQPLTLSMEHCARCQTCVDDCPIYEASGKEEIYRPTFRAEVLRRLYYKYEKGGNKLFKKFQQGDIDANWTMISRLLELSYRCTLCRRCAQSCPIGVDNGLITHELRKIFSMEMGLAPKELHEKGTVQQLEVGSSTGMNKVAVMDNVEFIDEDMTDRSGIKVETKWDVEARMFSLSITLVNSLPGLKIPAALLCCWMRRE